MFLHTWVYALWCILWCMCLCLCLCVYSRMQWIIRIFTVFQIVWSKENFVSSWLYKRTVLSCIEELFFLVNIYPIISSSQAMVWLTYLHDFEIWNICLVSHTLCAYHLGSVLGFCGLKACHKAKLNVPKFSIFLHYIGRRWLFVINYWCQNLLCFHRVFYSAGIFLNSLISDMDKELLPSSFTYVQLLGYSWRAVKLTEEWWKLNKEIVWLRLRFLS
jgi:hypothetical protein